MENFNKQTEQENFIEYWDKVINLWLAEPEEKDSEVIDARRPLPKKKKKQAIAELAYPSISYKIAAEIQEATGQETRVTVPGHFQRGGSPDAYDRLICTRFGVAAANLIIKKDYGKMVALNGEEIVAIPLSEVAGKLKAVPVDSPIVQAAKDLGISFGDC